MDRRQGDQLLNALAEFTAFYAKEARRRRGVAKKDQTSARREILAWLADLSPAQRAAVCITVDGSFVRLMIQIAAAPKSKSHARVDEFQILRPSKAKDATTTFVRRPILTSYDGDEILVPRGQEFENHALAFVDSMRLFNTQKSCDTLGPSLSILADLNAFLKLMDSLTFGDFLRSPSPDAAFLHGAPWCELPWLAQRGYYSLATYLAHQMEVNIWRHFINSRHVPTVGMLAIEHLAVEWHGASPAIHDEICQRLAHTTKSFIQELCPRPTYFSLKTSLGLLHQVMEQQPPSLQSATAEFSFSCSLTEAGRRPQVALIKLLWAEGLQKECAVLLSHSLASGTGLQEDDRAAVPSRKQLKKKAHSKQRKAKQRDMAQHKSRLSIVLSDMLRMQKQQQKQKAATLSLVAAVVADLVDQVCLLSSLEEKPKDPPKRLKKKTKKQLKLPSPARDDERRPGFLLLNLENSPSFYEPFPQTRHFFPEESSQNFPFALDPPSDETFFLPELFQEDDDDRSPQVVSGDWGFPTLSAAEWQNSFKWRHTETRLPTWLEPPRAEPKNQTAPCVDASTQADDNSTVEELQSLLDQQSKAMTAMQSELSILQRTVRDLQTTVFTLQSESKPTPPPTRFNGLFVSVPTSLLPPKTKLHWDICEFASHLQAETQARLAAHTAVSRFCVSAVQALWPRAQVRPYGSFVTGLSLPSSDLDLVICLPKVRRDEPAEAPGVLEGRNAIKETWQQNLARKLRSESWVVPESVKTIPNASIPIIALQTTAPYHVRLDISFEGPGHNGLATNDLVHSFLHELPALAPLMLVLKTFIIDRGLGVAYTGGLSSYALLLMVTRFLQEFEVGNRHQGVDTVSTQCNLVVSTQSRADFGTMLLGFLDFYGSKFDQRQTGISVASRCFLDRDALGQHSTSSTMWHNVQMEHVQFENLNLSSPGSRRQSLHWTGPLPFKQPNDYDPHKFDPVYIEDPLRPGNNVGRNCFRIMQIRRAFASAWATLNEAPVTLPSHTYVGGVALHPNNLLRSILTCTSEPKYKPHAAPFDQSPPHTTFPHHYHPLSSPVRQPPLRQNSVGKAKKQRHQMPQRRHSECVNDVQSITRPSSQDCLSPSSARSLSFADVVGKQFQSEEDRSDVVI
ncbi:unnamed protein product [Aphanomyces euteiches]